MSPLSNPLKVSKEIVKMLRSDPMATGLVKEHIPVREILRLFNISDEELFHILHEPDPVPSKDV
tara:strand:+ start:1891 stop:2082 length:192 start_codon:yes stop_codon:yes gene_type:complete